MMCVSARICRLLVVLRLSALIDVHYKKSDFRFGTTNSFKNKEKKTKLKLKLDYEFILEKKKKRAARRPCERSGLSADTWSATRFSNASNFQQWAVLRRILRFRIDLRLRRCSKHMGRLREQAFGRSSGFHYTNAATLPDEGRRQSELSSRRFSLREA